LEEAASLALVVVDPCLLQTRKRTVIDMFVTTPGHRITHQSSGPLIMSDNEDMPAIIATVETVRLMAHDAAAA